MSADTVGGVWVYALQLATALRRYGVQVVLATMGAPLSFQQRRQVEQVPDMVVCESHFRLEWMDAPWKDVEQAGQWLLQLERRYCPDLVHLNHYSHGDLDWRAPRLVVGHSCVLSWWRAVFSKEPPIDYDPYRWRVRQGLQGADLVVAPSRAMLSALKSHYGPLSRTTVVYNGRRHLEYACLKKKPYVLAVGRAWDAAKNLATLAHIAPSLQWPVYLAGEIKHPDGGHVELDHVRILGQLAPEFIAHWYGQASIYALPARYEPFGLSVLEAALAKCAPVIGDIDSLRELWDGAACFVPADDPQALQDTINRLIDDPARREAIAHLAAARAGKYTLERMAATYFALYQDLLEGLNFSEAQAPATLA
ncbi:glycosyltransferase family 4 protein [Nitrosococcus wardiae]|uniref:Glycosyltransferase n=1 Tax=Nitrosococcus wardiae TaxID=1814290 RepID=A0A4P7C015_9GAMM|nr:glycosyltransferase family 4 protein [Nitrosococcus wardiae]QBQ55741.1 glycosyltransferase [Nitrosococcus wardiae]